MTLTRRLAAMRREIILCNVCIIWYKYKCANASHPFAVHGLQSHSYFLSFFFFLSYRCVTRHAHMSKRRCAGTRYKCQRKSWQMPIQLNSMLDIVQYMHTPLLIIIFPPKNFHVKKLITHVLRFLQFKERRKVRHYWILVVIWSRTCAFNCLEFPFQSRYVLVTFANQ